MPVIRTYQCPDCQGTFEHLHDHYDDPPPLVCDLCGGDMRDTQPELAAPHLAKSIGKVADNVYRGMEQAAQNRAEMAAEALGENVSEMGAMKITNMRDDARAGETSSVVVNNEVTRVMAQTRGTTGLVDSRAGADFAKATRNGPFAGAGVQALQGVVKHHNPTAAQVSRNGNMGQHFPKP